MSVIGSSPEKTCIRCNERFTPHQTPYGLYMGYYCPDCREN